MATEYFNEHVQPDFMKSHYVKYYLLNQDFLKRFCTHDPFLPENFLCDLGYVGDLRADMH